MSNSILIMFACNDHRNGFARNELYGVDFDGALHLEPYIVDAKTAFRDGGGDWVRVGRRKFACHSYRNWLGNWCWDGARFSLEVAADLANHLRSMNIGGTPKWTIDQGHTELWDKWKSSEPFVAADFKTCLSGSQL